MKRGGPLPVYSRKRRGAIDRRREVVAEVKRRDNFRCQAAERLPSVVCAGHLDAHEIIPRSAWAAGYLEPTNILTVCRAHHQWIGDHPADAHALKLHGFSWERP